MKIIVWLKSPMPKWIGMLLLPSCVLFGMALVQWLIEKGWLK
jgi:hypothetical protein